MKAKLFTFIFTLFLVAGLNAQVLFVEDFNYTAGDSLGAHGWVSFSGGATNVLGVVAPGLTFTGYSGSNVGNAALVKPTGQDAYKQLTNPDSVGTFYISMMVKVDSMKTAGDYFFALLPSNSTTLYAARLYAKDSSGLRFGIIKSTVANGPLVYTADTYTLGTTYLLVVKYKFNTGSTTDDEISLFVFPSTIPATEPVPAVGPVTGLTTDMTNLGRIALRQGTAANAPYLTVDGFKISKSWTSVITSVQPLSTVAESFSLSQNYPNPFNPSTTINFSIPKSGFVTMKVYDVNGKEVKSLVSENMSAGKYEVNANFSTLNSGVYFYKLNVNGDANFSAVKKLMLVK